MQIGWGRRGLGTGKSVLFTHILCSALLSAWQSSHFIFAWVQMFVRGQKNLKKELPRNIQLIPDLDSLRKRGVWRKITSIGFPLPVQRIRSLEVASSFCQIKKLYKLKNPQLFLDPLEKWDHRWTTALKVEETHRQVFHDLLEWRGNSQAEAFLETSTRERKPEL